MPFRSGKDLALPPDRSETADIQSGIQEGFDQYHWPNRHQLLCADFRLFLGSGAELVSDLTMHSGTTVTYTSPQVH